VVVSSGDHYVQVRYPRGRWVTVAMKATRATAATAAAAAYRELLDTWGAAPRQCRVVSAAQLVREGGQRGIRLATAEIARHGDSKASRRARKPS
jgi:hypothetical protein